LKFRQLSLTKSLRPGRMKHHEEWSRVIAAAICYIDLLQQYRGRIYYSQR
jgi:hypothetical protein